MKSEAPSRLAAPQDVALAQVHALRRVALAVAHPGGPGLFASLVHELAASLPVAMVFAAVFTDDSRSRVRTLAVSLDGQLSPNFESPLKGIGCTTVARRSYQWVPSGLLAHLEPGSLLAGERMDALAACQLTDSGGAPLGLLVALDRSPIAEGDAEHAEAMLKVIAARVAAEIERERTDETLRAVALAVSGSRGGTVFEELVRLLATILHVDVAFIARHEPAQPDDLTMLAMYCGGQVQRDIRYPLAGSPCATVFGQRSRAYSSGLQALFPDDREIRGLGAEGYAGHPLAALDGTPIGIVAVASRRPLTQVGRVKATLKIFSVRAAAELERLQASESQKHAVEELRQREEQYRAIFEGSIDALYLWDEDLKVVDVNPAGLALYGHPREDVVGKSFPRSMPEAYVRERLAMLERALAGQSTHLETTVLRPDGSTIDADVRAMPFVHRGRPHVLTVVRDIGERRRRERELQRSEEQYRTIFNASIDALVLRDALFRIVDVNATYEAMTGFSREEVLGVDRVLANPQEVSTTIRELHVKALGGATIRLETHLLRRDGHRYELELRGVPILHRGEPHVLYIGRDITERTAAEQRRAELERQLRQAQKMDAIGQLTGGLAHDFNNILTSVLGYLGMAQERCAGKNQDAALARHLGQARLAAERAREHVAQLLAFSRPRRGERQLLAPAEVVAEVLQLLRPNLPSSIVVDCETGTPGDPAVPPVVADPVQFEQVLLNLCINARDAVGDHGRIRLRVVHAAAAGHCASCGARLDASRWVGFEVADDGSGISQDVIDRMFDPFFTTKEVGRGTGMGLAMVHGIVHDHDGHILVRSTPGQGSTFRVLLPAAAQEAGRAETLAALPAAPSPAPPLQGRVLLVEDEPGVGGFMQELMSGWGLEVVLERDPLSAARRLAAPGEAFSLLLTDQTMPGMTGLALARHASRQRPGLPVLLYTANAFDIGQDELSDCGVTTLLRKPIDTGALRPLLGQLLAGRVGSNALDRL